MSDLWNTEDRLNIDLDEYIFMDDGLMSTNHLTQAFMSDIKEAYIDDYKTRHWL